MEVLDEISEDEQGSKFSLMHSIVIFDSHALVDEIPINEQKVKSLCNFLSEIRSKFVFFKNSCIFKGVPGIYVF